MLVLFAPSVFAANLSLNDGRTISGQVIEKTPEKVKVDVDGIPMTFYADEIKAIDGQAWTAAAPVDVPATVTPQVSAALPSGSKKALVLQFIDVFGTRESMAANLENMLKEMPADNPDAQKLKNTIKVEEIIERLVPIYEKQFTEDELKAYIAFYSSPAGLKLKAGIPVIMRESVDASTQYFQEKFPEIAQGNKN